MRIMTFVLAATLAVGCKDKKATPVATGSGSSIADGSAGSAGSGGSAAPVDAKPAEGPSVLVLPKLEGDDVGTGPRKTTKPIDQAAHAKLVAMKYVGFTQEVRTDSDVLLDMRYVTEQRPRLAVVVKISPCPTGAAATSESRCEPMQPEAWMKRAPAIKAALQGGLAEHADTTVELGPLDVGGGTAAIYQYQLGYTIGVEEQGAGAYTDSYIIHYNDGVNQMRVSAEYKDDPTATLQDMLNVAPREDLAKIARSFFDVFGHAWAEKPAAGSGSATP